MKIIDFTVIKNENDQVFVVINPININSKTIFKKKQQTLIIENEEHSPYALLDLFDNISVKTLFIVEFGPLGFIQEVKLTF